MGGDEAELLNLVPSSSATLKRDSSLTRADREDDEALLPLNGVEWEN
jgi:hypothetical protein